MKKSLTELSEEIDAYLKPVDAHLRHIEAGQAKTVIVLASLVLAAEIWIACMIAASGKSILLGIMGHMTLSTFLAFYALFRRNERLDFRFEMLLFLFVLIFGPFGAGGMILAMLVYIFGSKNHATFDDFFESLSPNVARTRPQMIYDNLVSGRDDAVNPRSIISFLDVISFGTEAQKRQAIAKMTKHYQPEFAAVFRKALTDPSNMIRVQAATAIARIESQFLKRMNKLSIDDAVKKGKPDLILAMAKHYDSYAYTNLLDHDSTMINRNRALELYQKYLSLCPEDREVYTRIGRVMMRSGNYDKACYWFREYIDKGIDEGAISDTIADWYSESLYAAGRYQELREFRGRTKPMAQRGDIHPLSLKGALELWERPAYAKIG